MKRLLSLVAIVALVASLVPGTGIAGLRGAFDPIGRGDLAAADGVPYGNGLANGEQTPSIRPVPVGSANGIPLMERWFAFTTRDQVFGFETSREIWQGFNRTSAATLVATIGEARSKIIGDLTGQISYLDPCWSPNGKFLAYVQTNSTLTSSALLVQEYAASTSMATSITPIGAPITVVPDLAAVRNRHPDWSPDGNSLAFDSDASGTSIDIYTVQVFPTVGTPVRHTFVATRAEQNPSWAPDGVRIAYDTNKFGPNVIEIVNTSTDAVTLAEQNFAAVSHSHPGWSSDGNSIYYDAPESEDPQQNPDIWKLDLISQAKCSIHQDGAGDVNVDVSKYTNLTPDGVPYNNIYYESQAWAGVLGTPNLIIWRANPVFSCVPPLPMAVDFSPSTLKFSDKTNDGNPDQGGGGSPESDLGVTMSFPAETQAAGYQCLHLNGPKEGVRLRTGGLGPFSPTLMGLSAKSGNTDTGVDYNEANGSQTITVFWQRRRIETRLVSLGLVNTNVTMQVDAYSNNVGRRFRGFNVLKVTSSSLAGSAVKLEQNSPNPFNPVTKINYAVSKDSNVALRVYNVQGKLVKTLVNERLSQGMHEVSWDGRDANGSHVASGVYYAKVSSDGGSSDVIKMVMAK